MNRAPAGAAQLAAGELEAVFLPGRGMLGASLRHRGAELLRRVDDLEAAAAKGGTAGIPLLHPWANRPALDARGIPGGGGASPSHPARVTAALVSGEGLRLVEPGGGFRAAIQIRVEAR